MWSVLPTLHCCPGGMKLTFWKKIILQDFCPIASLKTFVGKQHSHTECFVLLYFLFTWPLSCGLELLAFCGVARCMVRSRAAWQLPDLEGRARLTLSNNGSARNALGKRKGIYWAENMEQKSRLALPLSPEWLYNCQGINFCHSQPPFPLRPPFIITHLRLSFPGILRGENRYFLCFCISLRNDYLRILPTHHLSPRYSQQVQHQNLAESVSWTYSFSGEPGFTGTVLQQALGHISCLK